MHVQGHQLSCTAFDYIFSVKANISSNIYFIDSLGRLLVFNLAQKEQVKCGFHPVQIFLSNAVWMRTVIICCKSQ